MKTSQNGINLIKKFEGCRLTAYKPVAAEKYWTIGYGHYGADVAPNMKISQAQAEAYLVADLKRFEDAVNATGLTLNQNQFDSLVSFAYNCGAGNLKKLVTGRTITQIADAMLAYNKGSGKVLPGLVKRRQAERDLFCSENNKEAAPAASLSPYQIGKTYTLQSDMYVRQTPNGSKLKYDSLTQDGKKNGKYDDEGNAILKKGTKVTCKSMSENWMQIPSGWVCAYNSSKVYIS